MDEIAFNVYPIEIWKQLNRGKCKFISFKLIVFDQNSKEAHFLSDRWGL